MAITRPYSLWKLKNYFEWQNHSFVSNQYTSQAFFQTLKTTNEPWKTIRLTTVFKSTIAICFNLLHVCSSIPFLYLLCCLYMYLLCLIAWFSLNLVTVLTVWILVNWDFKIGHYGRLGRLDRCHVTQNTRDLSPSSFWDGMFSPGFSSWRQRWNP